MISEGGRAGGSTDCPATEMRLLLNSAFPFQLFSITGLSQGCQSHTANMFPLKTQFRQASSPRARTETPLALRLALALRDAWSMERPLGGGSAVGFPTE